MNTTEILEKLISFPTTEGDPSGEDFLAWVSAFLKERGAEVSLQGEPGSPRNLWARLGPDVPGGVVLSGHYDVVAVGPGWRSPPFKTDRREGKIYGRGTCDMKGFLACMLALADRLKGAALELPVYFAMTHGEENDMAGVQSLLAWLKPQRKKFRLIWIGEPTEMAVVAAHKGVCGVVTSVSGVAAHSSRPSAGLNAIYRASDFIQWIRRMTKVARSKNHPGSLFDPPCTVFNVGTIKGGAACNIIPDRCEINWEYRLHPGDDEAAIWGAYKAFWDGENTPALAAFPSASVSEVVQIKVPPFEGGGEAEEVLALAKIAGAGGPLAGAFCTEAGFFQQLGAPTLICGPGAIAQAHQVDEFVAESQLAACDAALDRYLKDVAHAFGA